VSAEASARRVFALRTPEEIPLEFEVAPLGSRVLAVVVDLAIVVAMMVGLTFVGSVTGSRVAFAVALVGLFLARNAYFMFFELRWGGRTPGKRLLGLRVIARDGGPLTVQMVIARNLTRELEAFLPLQLMVSDATFLDLESFWLRLLSGLWIFGLLAIPLFNLHRARLGDLLAGTVVVTSPRVVLLEDPVERVRRKERVGKKRYTFTRAQLDVYGVYELQVLEKILREQAEDDPELLAEVCRRIRRKIDWPKTEEPVDPREFLNDFYAAQRGRLEQEMLFGRRRERKRS